MLLIVSVILCRMSSDDWIDLKLDLLRNAADSLILYAEGSPPSDGLGNESIAPDVTKLCLLRLVVCFIGSVVAFFCRALTRSDVI